MCQLTAVIPNKELTEQEAMLQRFLMTELLLTNSEKGNQDGVGLGNAEGVVTWEASAQTVVPGEEFLGYLEEMSGVPLIGHVRAISTGSKAKKGAHPFVESPIILAHNGTFRKYQDLDAYETFDGDDDPVDSNVVAREIQRKIGQGPLTKEVLKEVILEAEGSYALLIIDSSVRERNFWVVRGTNSLSTATIGPFRVINTSSGNLDAVLKTAQTVSRTCLGLDVEVSKSTTVGMRTINVVDSDADLIKVEDIPFQSKSTGSGRNYGNWYQEHYGKRTHTVSKYNWKRECDTAEARRIVEKVLDVSENVPGLFPYIINEACKYVFDREWYALDGEELDAVVDSMVEIYEKDFTKEKSRVWNALWVKMSPTMPYEELDEEMGVDIQFPYVLHSLEELKGFAEMAEVDTKEIEDV